MQIIGGRSGRSALCAVHHALAQPVSARCFRSSAISSQDETEASLNATSRTEDDFINTCYSGDHFASQYDGDKKTVITPVGELPISPLMDPSFHEARQKYTKPKPPRTEHPMNKFRRQLQRNPYAHALATPVRRCPISCTTLPSFFYQPFKLVSHPETGSPWFVPQGLDPKCRNTPTATQDGTADEIQPGSEPASLAQESSDSAQAGKKAVEASQTKPETDKTGPTAYVLSRQKLFQELQNPSSVYFKTQERLLRMSDHGQSRLSAVLKKAQWRSDLDSVLLELMRRRVVEGLCHFARLVEEDGREYIVKCELWNDVKGLKHRGCLLYLGPPADGASLSGSDSSGYVPPKLSTMDVGRARFGSALVVHNLRVLLGEEHMARLRKESGLFRDGSLYMLGRRATVNLQLSLWKLQGFVEWEEQATPDADEASDKTLEGEA